MAESTTVRPNIEALRGEVQSAVSFLAERLMEDVGENLLSLCVVGSALNEDFDARRSDINTVVVVRRRSHDLLKRMAGYGASMGKRKLRAPLLMTPEYIERSLDVFAVEFLEFQLQHQVVYGVDPFAELQFQPENVRLQCERELKGALMQLRQGYIHCLGKSKLVGDLLLACMGNLLALLRGMLWLRETERPRLGKETLEKAAVTFGFEGRALAELVELKRQHRRPGANEVETLFESTYQVIDQLARYIDTLRMKA